MESSRSSALRVVVVGGGASGTLVAAQLARQAVEPVEVAVVEPAPRPGRGVAYGTADAQHVLNVPARGMSALPDEPDHFRAWARLGPTDFAARRLYGDYLEATLDESWLGAPAGSRLLHVRDRAVGLLGAEAGPFRVATAGGGDLEADRVVLATGHGSPALPAWTRAAADLVVDPWVPGLVDRLGRDPHVLCVGTGLTFVDVALTVLAAHPGARVTGISRHGLLPHAHVLPLPEPAPAPELPDGELRLRPLLHDLRATGDDWRAAVDGLRPRTQEIWRRLGPADRRAFVAHVARHWEVRRHRMAPSVAERVEHHRRAGRLRVVAAPSVSVVRHGGQAVVTVGTERLRVDAVVACTGPSADLTATPLGARLVATGRARPGPLGLGVDCEPDSGAVVTAAGRPDPRLGVVGPLRRGVLWETTAIPEIREQAAATAAHALRDLPAAVGAPA
ncbi:MAG: FAD/NAD(P)-binding protein [Nocardioidaceae bacterium]